jgi:hypothetical protein
MMKDLASATSSPPAEFTVDSYLMRNCLEFQKPLYFERETGLNFGGMVPFAALWIEVTQNPRTVKSHFPRKNFLSGLSCLFQSCEVVILAKVNCFIVLLFHLFLFELLRFVLLLG